MKNKKGFVMTETLVVTLFLVSIFSFIYVSIVPLMGKYEDMIDREQDIDIVYKLYNIRKLLLSDENRVTLTNSSFKNFTEVVVGDPTPSENTPVGRFCSKFNRSQYCKSLMEYLELTDFTFIYTNDIYANLGTFETLNTDLFDYISKYQNALEKVVILLDNTTHKMAHLLYSGE